jgi:hypothetical protein
LKKWKSNNFFIVGIVYVCKLSNKIIATKKMPVLTQFSKLWNNIFWNGHKKIGRQVGGLFKDINPNYLVTEKRSVTVPLSVPITTV